MTAPKSCRESNPKYLHSTPLPLRGLEPPGLNRDMGGDSRTRNPPGGSPGNLRRSIRALHRSHHEVWERPAVSRAVRGGKQSPAEFFCMKYPQTTPLPSCSVPFPFLLCGEEERTTELPFRAFHTKAKYPQSYTVAEGVYAIYFNILFYLSISLFQYLYGSYIYYYCILGAVAT